MASSLRSTKLHASSKGTAWQTKRGALFVENAQRPDASATVQLTVSLARKDYRLLEVLKDDVASYIDELIASHCRGLRKSIEHNNKVKHANKK